MEELVIENFNEEFKEVNLDTIEKKMDNTGFGDMLNEMRKKRIIENIKNLNLFEHQEIFKIIKKQHIKYSENSNGIFINMNKLSEKTIGEIDTFITYCNSNKDKFKNENKIRTNLKKFVDNRISQEKKEETLCVNPNNKIEDTIEKGISYEEDNMDDDNLDDIEDIECSKEVDDNSKIIIDNNLDKIIMNDLNII